LTVKETTIVLLIFDLQWILLNYEVFELSNVLQSQIMVLLFMFIQL